MHTSATPSRRNLLLTGTILCFTAAAASAGMVTWSPAMNIAGDSDVSVNGTLVVANNLGGPGTAATAINGVVFQPFIVDGSANSFTVGISTVSAASSVNPAATGTWQALSAAYTTLLTSALTLKADQLYTLSLSGLAPGKNYEFQVWANNSTRSSEAPWYYRTSVGDGLGNAVELYAGDNGIGGGPNGSNASPLPGQFALGTFTADGSGIQQFFLVNGEIDGWINGFQLRQVEIVPVPEPGTLVTGLLALGAFTGCLLARKRKD